MRTKRNDKRKKNPDEVRNSLMAREKFILMRWLDARSENGVVQFDNVDDATEAFNEPTQSDPDGKAKVTRNNINASVKALGLKFKNARRSGRASDSKRLASIEARIDEITNWIDTIDQGWRDNG